MTKPKLRVSLTLDKSWGNAGDTHSDLLTSLGLALTLTGAWVTARARVLIRNNASIMPDSKHTTRRSQKARDCKPCPPTTYTDAAQMRGVC